MCGSEQAERHLHHVQMRRHKALTGVGTSVILPTYAFQRRPSLHSNITLAIALTAWTAMSDSNNMGHLYLGGSLLLSQDHALCPTFAG